MVRGSHGHQLIPIVLHSLIGPVAKSRCFVTVDINKNGPPVAAQWYDIWAGATAVMGMCVVDGKAGISSMQGISLGLFSFPTQTY